METEEYIPSSSASQNRGKFNLSLPRFGIHFHLCTGIDASRTGSALVRQILAGEGS